MERIKTPFGFSSTADEIVSGTYLTGRRIIVTGGSSGIGIETARSLARTNADVTLAVRSIEAGEKVAAEIKEETGNPNVFVRRLDLSSQGSVKEFVAGWEGPLHVLINNAGIMALPTL